MCPDLTKNSGSTALFNRQYAHEKAQLGLEMDRFLHPTSFNGADHLEDLAPFAHPGPDANLPIAHRLADISPCNAALARTIYNLFKNFWSEFGVLPACKYGSMFVGALHFSRPLLWHGPPQLLGLP
jgi:hypothetical protein